MAVWLFIIIAAVVLVVLGTVEAFWFDGFWLDLLSADLLNPILTLLLVLALVLGSACAFWININKRLRRYGQLIIGMLVVGLFIIKAIAAYVNYESLTPQARHIISATAHISTISDGVYDPVLGSAYRQEAVLYDIQPAAPSNSVQALNVHNPFGDESSASTDGDPKLFAAMEGMTVMLSAHPNFTKTNLDALTTVTPGTAMTVQLLITPVDRAVSADGFDVNQWLKTRYVHANAQILQIDEMDSWTPKSFGARFRLMLEQFRQQLRSHFYQDWQAETATRAQANAVTLSLMTGDRALIDKHTKDLYQLAGISHLLAISGTHVLFLAMILSGLVTWISDRYGLIVYQRIPRWQIRMVVMVVASVVYALFTGFDVPAVRTVYLLIAAWLIRYFVLPIGMVSALSWVALLMVWIDPYVLWQAGFWLSFIAVLLLMRYELSEAQLAGDQNSALWRPNLWLNTFWQATKLQFWLFFAMLPLSILLFGKISIWGLFVNLFAIGLFGFVVVPINLLAGTLFLISQTLADGLWQLSSQVLYMLHAMLNFSLGHQIGAVSAWLYAPFGMAGFILCFLVVGMLILPKVLPRSLIILPLLATAFMAFERPSSSLVLIDLPTDSGQVSQSLLIHFDGKNSHYWLILNDLGARSLRANHTQTLIDQLHRQGAARAGLDGIIVQSNSAIFMPTIAELAASMPVHRYWQAGHHPQLASIRYEPCQAGMTWQSDGLTLRALTGWHEIEDVRMHHCEIEVLSDQALALVGLTPSPDQMPDNAPNQRPIESDTAKTQIIFNTSSESILWQLWEMLCVRDDALKITDDAHYHSHWLTSPHTANSDTLKTKLPQATVLMMQ